MTLIRNILLFCVITTAIACSGLQKKEKNPTEPLVKITTKFGEMYVELSDSTPKHKTNFIKLAKEGFYDSLLFHRVMKGFMIQGGDPASKNTSPNAQLGNGGPGYTIPANFNPSLFHKKGTIATARNPDNVNPTKASSGSQFYIAQGKVYTEEQLKNMEKAMKARNPDYSMSPEIIAAYTTVGGIPHLDGNYTVFGQVIKGIEVIDKVAAVPVNRSNNHRPRADVRMSMEVVYLNAKEKEKLLAE